MTTETLERLDLLRAISGSAPTPTILIDDMTDLPSTEVWLVGYFVYGSSFIHSVNLHGNCLHVMIAEDHRLVRVQSDAIEVWADGTDVCLHHEGVNSRRKRYAGLLERDVVTSKCPPVTRSTWLPVGNDGVRVP